MLQTASKDFIFTLCKIVLNASKGTIPLIRAQYQKLKKKKAEIRLLADKKVCVKKKTAIHKKARKEKTV